MSLDRKILERIERENIKIRPRWFFVVKDFIFGTGLFFWMAVSSSSVALFLEITTKKDLVPYAMGLLWAVFLVVGYQFLIRTNALYKVSFSAMIAVILSFNLVFGYLAFASGKAEEVENFLEKSPAYSAIMQIAQTSVPGTEDGAGSVLEGSGRAESAIENNDESDFMSSDDEDDDEIKDDEESEQIIKDPKKPIMQFFTEMENNEDIDEEELDDEQEISEDFEAAGIEKDADEDDDDSEEKSVNDAYELDDEEEDETSEEKEAD